jgi:hypothetical protein
LVGVYIAFDDTTIEILGREANPVLPPTTTVGGKHGRNRTCPPGRVRADEAIFQNDHVSDSESGSECHCLLTELSSRFLKKHKRPGANPTSPVNCLQLPVHPWSAKANDNYSARRLSAEFLPERLSATSS